jgi:hypothetical protein
MSIGIVIFSKFYLPFKKLLKMKKKIFKNSLSALVSALMLVSCGEDEKSLTGFTFEPAAVTVIKGQTGTVTATPVPADAGGVSYKWAVEDITIADISGNGSTATITAKKAGTTNISVTCGSIVAKASLTVSRDLALKDINITADATTMELGGTIELKATPDPADAEEVASTFKWSSSDESIITLAPQTGASTTLTAVAFGTVTITVSNASGSVKKTIDIKVGSAAQPVLKMAVGLWTFDDANNLGKADPRTDLEEYALDAPIDLEILPAAHNGAVEQIPGPTATNKAVSTPYQTATQSVTFTPEGLRYKHPVVGFGLTHYTIMYDVRFPRDETIPVGTTGTWYHVWYTDLNVMYACMGRYGAVTDLDKNAISVGCAGSYIAIHSFQTDQTSTHTPWMRIVFVYEDGIVHVYRDGEFVWDHTAFNTEDRRAQYCLKVGVPIYFGTGRYDGDKYIKSFDLATVAIWGKTLTEEEVRALGDISQMPPADLE